MRSWSLAPPLDEAAQGVGFPLGTIERSSRSSATPLTLRSGPGP